MALLKLHQQEETTPVAHGSTFRVFLEVKDFELDGKAVKDFPRVVDLSLSVYEVEEGKREGTPRALCESFLIQGLTVNIPTDGKRGDPRYYASFFFWVSSRMPASTNITRRHS